MLVRKRGFAHQKVPVYQDGDSGVQKPGAVGTSQAIPVRIVTAPRARAFKRVPFKVGEA